MENKHHYLLPCSNPDCSKILRLSISEMNFGKEVEVTCPSCGTKSLAVIPDYGKLGDLLQKLGSIINETLSENGEVIDTINTIIEEGFHIELAIFGRVNPIFQDKPAKPVQSKVRDGEIKLGTFSSKDTE